MRLVSQEGAEPAALQSIVRLPEADGIVTVPDADAVVTLPEADAEELPNVSSNGLAQAGPPGVIGLLAPAPQPRREAGGFRSA